MNILVIGNGFDLAHGLPTKYTDFLDFCRRVFPVYENVGDRGVNLYQQEYLFNWNFNEEIKEKLENAYSSRRKNTTKENISQIETSDPKLDEMYTLIKDNIWIEYFLQCNMYQKENWIDFESEISEVIKSLNKDVQDFKLENNIQRLSNIFLSEKYCDDPQAVFTHKGKQYYSQKLTYKILRDKLLIDLNGLIRAFEIYLTEYVEKIKIRKKSADISKLNIDLVLSFNYTHTFSKLYKVSNKLKKENVHLFDYVHGETSSSSTIETNNMVLGIDEYLSEDRKNKDIDFIAFKKFYQRIYKQTSCEYKKWVNEIQNKHNRYYKYVNYWENRISSARNRGDYREASRLYNKMNKYKEQYNINNVYIFGHSLDVTDKDILRELILTDNVHTTIFYHSKKIMGQQIANLVKVIGQDKLIRRTNEDTKIIKFKLQRPMVEIK